MGAYQPYLYTGKEFLIERYLALGAEDCPPGTYDPFSQEFPGFAAEKLREIGETGTDGYPVLSDIDHERALTFRTIPAMPDTRLFFAVEIISRREERAHLHVRAQTGCKTWLNGEILTLHASRWIGECLVSGSLKRGRNWLVVEQYAPTPDMLFGVLVRRYAQECGDAPLALSHIAHYVAIDPPRAAYEEPYQPEAAQYRLLYLPHPDYLPTYRMEVHDMAIGLVETRQCVLGETVTLSLARLRALSPEPLRHEQINCVFTRRDGGETMHGISLVITPFEERETEVREALLACADELGQEQSAQARGALAWHDRLTDPVGRYWRTRQEWIWTAELREGRRPRGFYYRGGCHEIFFRSRLDGEYVRLLAYVPEGFDPSVHYPLFLALSTGNEGYFSLWLRQEQYDEPFLAIDATGRGFTGGSYIGEASTLEILEWAKAHFPVDEDRVYILGSSNGGYATWTVAENYPHLAAAVYPLIGFPNLSAIENLSNVPVYLLVSEKDHVYRGQTTVFRKTLGRYGKLTQWDFKERAHHHFLAFLGHPTVLRAMLTHRREPYPRDIRFVCLRNRHRESFWVRLHGIARGRRRARIHARVLSERLIDIRLQGADGVTLRLPPAIDRSAFTVRINGVEVPFREITSPRVILARRGGRWREAGEEPTPDRRKGTGLLDVYLGPMRIVLPAGEEPAMERAAAMLSSPKTNGLDPNLVVQYPILRDGALPAYLLENHLILLDIGGNNSVLRRFADRLPVRTEAAGLVYRGERIEGSYVVMQVIANPWDGERSILAITASDAALLQRHILLRRVILPTYLNGLHPFWNSEILVFTGGRYLAAYEEGAPLKPVL